MRTVVITPPAPVVTWAEADKHLRLDGDTDEQAYVESLIAAATAHIDGPAGWLGRAIGVQTLEARCDVFRDAMMLPFPPLIDIVSVKYLDAAGAEIAVLASEYETRGQLIGSAFGKRWPPVACHPESVRIRYRAGYVVALDADPLVSSVPAPIKAAILLMVGDMFRSRASFATMTVAAVPMAAPVAALLAPYRVFR